MDKRGAERVRALVALHGLPEAYESDWGDGAVRRFVRRAGDHLEPLLDLAGADLTTRFEHKRAAAHARLADLRDRIARLARGEALRPELPTGLGTLVIDELGLPRGPEVGQAMERVREGILDGELPARPSAAECLAYLRAIDGA
jgi:poly(A) polymerase